MQACSDATFASSARSAQLYNLHNGDSDDMLQVLREEEDAAAARAVSSAVEKTQTQSLSKVSSLALRHFHFAFSRQTCASLTE